MSVSVDRGLARHLWHLRTFYAVVGEFVLLAMVVGVLVLISMAAGSVLTVLFVASLLMIPRLIAQSEVESGVGTDFNPDEMQKEDLRRVELVCGIIDSRVRLGIPPIVVVRGRSAAFILMAPERNDAVIVWTRGLIQRHDDQTLAAVTAHELGHLYAWDYQLAYLCSPPYDFILGLIAFPRRWGGWGRALSSVLFAPFLPFAALMAAISRQREYAADAFMVWVMGDIESFCNVLDEHGSGGIGPLVECDLWASLERSGMLLCSHPTDLERREELEKCLRSTV